MISDCWIGKVLERCSHGLIEVNTIPAFAWRDRGNCTNPGFLSKIQNRHL